ncbi:MAG: ABC transporter ATP-binding protein/permease [Opitutales bacterium]|nr:ABC transporter ATP-binding protein/permease [Opitutales bacterium]
MNNLKKFLPYFAYLKPVWGRFTLGILFGILFSVSSGLGLPVMAETIFPILFGNVDQAPDWLAAFVERWFGDNIEGGFLIVCCLLIPFTMGLRALGAFGNGYYMTYSGVYVVQSIQRDLFARLQILPVAFFQRYKTGELMAALLGYPQQIKTIVVDTSNDLVKQPLTLLSAVGFLLYKSFTSESFFVAAVGVLSIPLVVFPIRQIGKYLAKRSRQLVKETEALQSSAIETVQSPLEIRAYNLERRQLMAFREKLKRIFFLTMKSVRSKLMISPSIEFVAASGLALALFLGVRAGITQGEFMALGVALYMAYTPIKRLGNIHGALKALEAPLKRVEDVLHAPDSIPEPENPIPMPQRVQGEIFFENVSFTYTKDLPVLRNITVRIHSGETVALVGPSGAGKSTFINLIPRFFEATQGQVFIDGVPISDVRQSELRAQVAYVPQMPVLFNASVFENIALGKEGASVEEVYRAARMARADSFISALPEGYDTVLRERGSSLSGGQRQRIAIARAFLKDAPILILDEATSALDNKIDAEIQEALRELSSGRTTLVIAHRINSLNHIKRRLYFENGEILGDGDHDTLLGSCEGYRKLIQK